MLSAKEKNKPGVDDRKCQSGNGRRVVILARAPEKASMRRW